MTTLNRFEKDESDAEQSDDSEPPVFDPSKRGSLLPNNKRGSIFQVITEAKRGSIFQLEGMGKRGSIFQAYDINKPRGSVYQLFDDPYRGDEPIAVQFEDLRKFSRANIKIKKSVQFKELTDYQTQQLRKQILYQGEYRVLNLSVLFIISLIVFGIIFMSAWHYNNNNYWVLYLVLGLLLGAAMLNVMAVKLYFNYKRYHGNRGVKDLVIENLGFDKEAEGVGDTAVKEIKVVETSTV